MNDLYALALIQLLGAMSPGPDSMLVMNNSLSGSKKLGVYTALGIVSALLIHVLYINLGISFLFLKCSNLLFFIKIIGALYLSFLGFKMIFTSKNIDSMNANIEMKSSLKAFQEGFFCNILNPKAILFLIGIFTLVINKKNELYYNVIYIAEILLIPFLWFFLISFLINIKIVKEKLVKFQKVIIFTMGIALIFFAIKLSFF